MFDYITKDLPNFLNKHYPIDTEKSSITGHSMGGHGALMIHLKNPAKFKSVSAFAPACNLSRADRFAKAYEANTSSSVISRHLKNFQLKQFLDLYGLC